MASKLGVIRKKTQREIVEENVIAMEDGSFKCNVDESCQFAQKPLVHGNFVRHIRLLHPEKVHVLELPERRKLSSGSDLASTDGSTVGDVQVPGTSASAGAVSHAGNGAGVGPVPVKKVKKERPLLVYTDKRKVLLGTLQMATIHALPLSFPNYAGFENLVKPTWDAVGLTVNRQKLTELVEHAAELARKIITDEMAKKMITLEIDSASRRNRHVFGIYATYFSDKKGGPVSRCLAVKEMVKSQTADHLKDTMQTEAMGRYKMLSGQLYAVIADNGPNMQASIRQLGSITSVEL